MNRALKQWEHDAVARGCTYSWRPATDDDVAHVLWTGGPDMDCPSCGEHLCGMGDEKLREVVAKVRAMDGLHGITVRLPFMSTRCGFASLDFSVETRELVGLSGVRVNEVQS